MRAAAVSLIRRPVRGDGVLRCMRADSPVGRVGVGGAHTRPRRASGPGDALEQDRICDWTRACERGVPPGREPRERYVSGVLPASIGDRAPGYGWVAGVRD